MKEIFNSIIDNKKNEVFEKDDENEKLLQLLPEELREKSIRENYSLEYIHKIIQFREKEGYKVVSGFHVSPVKLEVGGSIIGGQDGDVCFSTDLKELYLGKGGSGYIYAIECSEKFMKPLDINLGWYTLKGKVRIIDRIKMTPENIKSLGACFAECEYS